MVDSILLQSNNEVWLTPEEIWRPAATLLGGIDLDPCAETDDPTLANIPAKLHFTKAINALSRDWLFPSGDQVTVFMNPPYNKCQDHRKFVDKLLHEWSVGHVKQAVVLLASRTETIWYRALGQFPRCHVDHRLSFLTIDGRIKHNAIFPSVVFGLGMTTHTFCRAYRRLGEIVVRY